MKQFILIIFFLCTFLSKTHGETLKLDVESINKNVELYDIGRIIYMPEMGVLFYYAPKIHESATIYDLIKKKSFVMGVKGNGPDQFKLLRFPFTDGNNFYIYDIVSHKLLEYLFLQDSIKLNDIIPVKKLGVGFDFGEKDFLGKVGDSWIVQNLVYRDLTNIKDKTKFPMTNDIYLGTLNRDFKGYNEIMKVKGKGYPQICHSYDNYLCFSNNEHYIVQITAANFDTKKKVMIIPVIHLKTKKVIQLKIKVPEKYVYYQAEDNEDDKSWRIKQSKYKYIPRGSRFLGLDENYYFCYFHYNKDGSFDILYNVLDFKSMKINQYEQLNTKMKPMIADNENIAFLKELEEDNFKLVLAPKNSIFKKVVNNKQ